MASKHKFLAFSVAFFLCWPVLVCADVDDLGSGIVAEVDGSSISRVEFELELMTLQNRMRAEGRTIDDFLEAQLREQAIESLINAELLCVTARAKGLHVDPEAISIQIRAVQGVAGGAEEFQRMLREIHFTETQLRIHFEKSLLAEALIEDRFSKLPPANEGELKAYYKEHTDRFQKSEQVRISHILVAFDPNGTPAEKVQAQKRINEIQEQIRQGKDFASLAKAFSACPSSAQGGDVGFFSRGQMEPTFATAAFALQQKGQYSDIVLTSQGFHILRLTDRGNTETAPFEEVREDIARQLRQEQLHDFMRRFLGDLRRNAQIKRFPIASSVGAPARNNGPQLPKP
jgi:peptidyl-prolyl cis-trans isomerase C